jgi:hypothetical protein
MKLTRKNLTLLLIIGIMIYGILIITNWGPHCAAGGPDLGSPKDASCSISSDFFAQYHIELSYLFILPLVSFFLLITQHCIPSGFYISLFKPPKPL